MRSHDVQTYCTLAVTAAVPFSVNVQVLLLLPLLEHAPDQMALRSPETVSVIDVPVENDADAVLPTATLMPDGLEVTPCPVLPVALTVSVAVLPGGGGGGGGGAEASGFTVSVAGLVTPPPDTEIVTSVCCATAVVKMLNPPRVTPDGTTMLFGT
jgi:hypothetical protein